LKENEEEKKAPVSAKPRRLQPLKKIKRQRSGETGGVAGFESGLRSASAKAYSVTLAKLEEIRNITALGESVCGVKMREMIMRINR